MAVGAGAGRVPAGRIGAPRVSAAWHDVALPDIGATRIDPYWIWANATAFDALGGRQAGAEPWISVVLELKRPVYQAAPSCPAHLCRIPEIHRVGGPGGLARTRFCTARVTEAFFDPASNPWLANVERFELGLPIVETRVGPREGPDHIGIVDPGGPTALRAVPVLAVIDTGLPFANERLMDAAGFSRCLGLWDQNGVDARPPRGLPYGMFARRSDVLAALGDHRVAAAGGRPEHESVLYAAMGLDTLRARWTHGSAVLGLAADRDDRAGAPNEGAPWYLGVELPRRSSDDTSGASLAVHALDALRFVIVAAERAATEMRRLPGPIVVNLSYGRFAGAHDGSSMLASAIDELLDLYNDDSRRLAVVLSAGNGQLAEGHARVDVPTRGEVALTWRVLPDDHTPSFLELWPGAAVEDLVVVLTPPGGGPAVEVGPGRCVALREGDDCIATVGHHVCSAAGEGPMVLVAIAPTASHDVHRALAASGRWTVTLRNCGDRPLRVGAWIQRDDLFGPSRLRGRQSRFEDPAYARRDERGFVLDTDPADATGVVRRVDTLNPAATGRFTVVAGARVLGDGRVSRYSAAGEVGAGRRVPDLTAVADRSACRPGILTRGTFSGSVAVASGTSLAAPQVARWLVDLLAREAAPTTAPRAAWARELVAARLGVEPAQDPRRQEGPPRAAMLSGAVSRRGEAAALGAPRIPGVMDD